MNRPLSPHMSVYRMFRYTMFTSFANRATGAVLSAGLLVLVYWLMAVASGAAAYARAMSVLSSPVFKLLYAIWLLTFAYHLTAGVRHLIWDTGRGMERGQSRISARIVIGVGLVLGILLIYWAFCPGAHQS
jgi:succinate dehydrogenase / fumarate reductase cytochrome b subunit